MGWRVDIAVRKLCVEAAINKVQRLAVDLHLDIPLPLPPVAPCLGKGVTARDQCDNAQRFAGGMTEGRVASFKASCGDVTDPEFPWSPSQANIGAERVTIQGQGRLPAGQDSNLYHLFAFRRGGPLPIGVHRRQAEISFFTRRCQSCPMPRRAIVRLNGFPAKLNGVRVRGVERAQGQSLAPLVFWCRIRRLWFSSPSTL